MRPFVSHGLRLLQRRDFGSSEVATGRLIKKNTIAQDIIISLDIRSDALVPPEFVLGVEDHGDERKLGFVNRHATLVQDTT